MQKLKTKITGLAFFLVIVCISCDKDTTVGWGTPKEAEEEGPVIDPSESSITIDIEVAKWDVRTQDVDL